VGAGIHRGGSALSKPAVSPQDSSREIRAERLGTNRLLQRLQPEHGELAAIGLTAVGLSRSHDGQLGQPPLAENRPPPGAAGSERAFRPRRCS
jgi:hypothetical protein